jgi:hypothetical protein
MFYNSLLELYQYVNADVAKLADALDLGSSAARRGGSSPSIRTILYLNITRENYGQGFDNRIQSLWEC